MKYRVVHKTTYSGRQSVSIGHNQAWLEPRLVARQWLESFSLKIDPEPSIRSRRVDFFGNPVTLFSFNDGYDQLDVTATTLVTITAVRDYADELSRRQSPEWKDVAKSVAEHSAGATLEASQFLYPSPRIQWSEEMRTYAEESFTGSRPILVGLQHLTQRIHKEFAYDPKSTTVTTPVHEVFRIRRGVCQDFAHLQIAMLRSLGLPARYVSGYLRTYPAEGKPRLVGADASHAWLSCFCGTAGWVDVDPTNNKFIASDHVTLAWGRDYSDVPPVTGVFIGGGQHRLAVEVDVLPLG